MVKDALCNCQKVRYIGLTINLYRLQSEDILIKQLKAGNTLAFSSLYHRYSARIYHFALSIVKSPALAEDVTHDVFVKLWENADKIDLALSFQSYLFTITRNHILNLLKRAGRSTLIVDEIMRYTAVISDDPSQILQRKQAHDLLEVAVETLPEQRRKIYQLCKNEGFTYKEVAEQLGISPSTVNSQMVKAIKSVQDFLLLSGALSVIIYVWPFL